jgi:hypothetical protein
MSDANPERRYESKCFAISPVGAAARCDLLILFFKVKRSQPRFTRQLLQGGLNTIHDPRDHCLAIDGRQRLPMMAITRIA